MIHVVHIPFVIGQSEVSNVGEVDPSVVGTKVATVCIFQQV